MLLKKPKTQIKKKIFNYLAALEGTWKQEALVSVVKERFVLTERDAEEVIEEFSGLPKVLFQKIKNEEIRPRLNAH